MDKILFVLQNSNNPSTFILKDLKLLQEKYEVIPIKLPSLKGLAGLYYQINLLLTILFYVRSAKFIFVRFADYHSFFPVLISKFSSLKSVLILGGYDVDCLPKYDYGVCSNLFRKYISNFAIQNSSYVFPVCSKLAEIAKKRVGRINGYYHVIPNGFHINKWFCDTDKQDIILTIGNYSDKKTCKIKGLDFFVEVARNFRKVKFIIIGGSSPERHYFLDLPSNLILLPKFNQKEIRYYCSISKIYAQFSLSEGMPNALCEAMLCECVPIGTNVGGIPDVINKKELILSERTVYNASEIIEESLLQYNNWGKDARNYICQNFSIDNRKNLIYDMIDQQN